MNFRVGQRVVCINEFPDIARKHVPRLPTKGAVYTVRSVLIGWLGFPDPAVRLREIRNPTSPLLHSEPAFGAGFFRPVKETNIDVFTALLAPSPTKVKEKA